PPGGRAGALPGAPGRHRAAARGRRRRRARAAVRRGACGAQPMAEVLELKAARGARGSVRLPGSKSISNRVLLAAALAAGETEVSGLLDADDTRVMREALSRLGIALIDNVDGLKIRGGAGAFAEKKASLFL